MNNPTFPLEEPIRRRLHARGGRADATTHATEARTGDTHPVADPLALDPLSPIPVDRATATSVGPLGLDPLSPLGPDAG